MTIHDEIRYYRSKQDLWDIGLHEDSAADAAEQAIYEIARSAGYLTTQAARIAAQYGRSLNL
jgi:hypothetical protein